MVDPMGFGNVVGEYDESGTLLSRYTHGLGLISKDENFYTFDGNGNTSEMTNGANEIINFYGYEPFGNNLFEVESVENDFEFVGQLGVREMRDGLIYMRNRFYSPALGRFMAEDPIGLAGGDVSFYRYVSNDPVNFVDPTGLTVATWDTPFDNRDNVLEGGIGGGGGRGTLTIPPIMDLLWPKDDASSDDKAATDATDNAKVETCDEAVPDNECEDDPCKDVPCDPPAGEIFNIKIHWESHSTTPGKGTHGCEEKTGSPVHWHHSVMNQNPETCQCFEENHAFGGCGPGPE